MLISYQNYACKKGKGKFFEGEEYEDEYNVGDVFYSHVWGDFMTYIYSNHILFNNFFTDEKNLMFRVALLVSLVLFDVMI